MEQNTVEISKGLRFIFVGLCLSILTMLPVLPYQGVFVASILSFGITVSGLIFAGRGDRKYYIPLVLLTVNTLGVEMLQGQFSGIVIFWLAILRLALGTAALSLICAFTVPWAAKKREKTTRIGRWAWKGCVASGVLVLAFNLTAAPGMELLAAVLGLMGIAALVFTAGIYLIFLWQAGTLLRG